MQIGQKELKLNLENQWMRFQEKCQNGDSKLAVVTFKIDKINMKVKKVSI